MKNRKSIIISCIAIITIVFAGWILKEKELPAAMDILGTASTQEELCTKHQISVAECFFCDATLREPGRLWCEEHERYEDRCFICHPEIKEANRLWCEEHKLYEDECFFCHPELREVQNRSIEKKASISPIVKDEDMFSGGLQCLEHRVLEIECGICHPELIETLQPGQGLKIRLESSESAVMAGVKTEFPTLGSPLPEVVFLGELLYDQNHLARITPLVGGVIRRVLADIGDDVANGTVLAEISSPEVALAKSEYLSAIADEALKTLVFKRERELVEKRVSAQREYEQAQAEYQIAGNNTRRAQQQLLNYGFIEEEVQEIAQTNSTSSHLPIRVPFSGKLIDRNAVIGEAVKPGDMLFTVADLSLMWLELSIPEDKLGLIRLGDQVEVTFDALLGLSFQGQLGWISSSIDDQTRSIKARVILSNDGLILKHGMFGKVKLLREESKPGLLIPSNAVQRLNGIPVVFVKLEDDLYDARKVTLGGKTKEQVEVAGGILSGDEVVVAHSYTLKSEFLKSRLGAGCVDE